MLLVGRPGSQALVAGLISGIKISRGLSSLHCGTCQANLLIRGRSYRSFSAQPIPPPTMVYSYSAPFETGKLKVSDVHSLQLVHYQVLGPFFFTPLTRRTATKSPGKRKELQVRFCDC